MAKLFVFYEAVEEDVVCDNCEYIDTLKYHEDHDFSIADKHDIDQDYTCPKCGHKQKITVRKDQMF